jgi:outer membrane translocation and assembly module TamA
MPPIDSVLFVDTGNVWTQPSNVFGPPFALRVAIGTGIRVVTPVGPLVFDYGINVTRHDYLAEDFGAFNFAIGLF